MRAFYFEQFELGIDAASSRKACQLAPCPEDAVAGNNNRKRICTKGAADCLRISAVPKLDCNIPICAGLARQNGAGQLLNICSEWLDIGEIAVDEGQIIRLAGKKVEYARNGGINEFRRLTFDGVVHLLDQAADSQLRRRIRKMRAANLAAPLCDGAGAD